MKKLILTVVAGFLVMGMYSQDYITDQIPKDKKYMPTEVLDKKYGIQLYESLNMFLGGDSIRNCDGYACSGWKKDYYENGQLLHKGYYVDGKLKIYKNYYPNGQLERRFHTVDDYKCKMEKYYVDGTVKSEVTYIEGEPVEWKDFYSNGQLDYHEEYHKSMSYYLLQKSFKEDGQPLSIMELENKRKMLYLKQEYHENGKLKTEGNVWYDENFFEYKKVGKWTIYNENGDKIKQLTYQNGELMKEKSY